MTQTQKPPTPTPNQPAEGGSIALRDPSQLATGAGIVTLVIGTALTAQPARAAGLLGLGIGPRVARLLGASDLIVGPALLSGRRRAPWMAVRTALNFVIAGQYHRAARSGDQRRVAKVGLAVMGALTVFDGFIALALARQERGAGG